MPRIGCPHQKAMHAKFIHRVTPEGGIGLLRLADIEQINLVLIDELLKVLHVHKFLNICHMLILLHRIPPVSHQTAKQLCHIRQLLHGSIVKLARQQTPLPVSLRCLRPVHSCGRGQPEYILHWDNAYISHGTHGEQDQLPVHTLLIYTIKVCIQKSTFGCAKPPVPSNRRVVIMCSCVNYTVFLISVWQIDTATIWLESEMKHLQARKARRVKQFKNLWRQIAQILGYKWQLTKSIFELKKKVDARAGIA